MSWREILAGVVVGWLLGAYLRASGPPEERLNVLVELEYGPGEPGC